MNILIIGYFGFLDNQLDGQTIKTRNIYDLLENNISDNFNLMFFDTQIFKKNKLHIIKLIYLLLKADVVFDVAAHGNLKYLFPIIYSLLKLKRAKLNIIPVGGWLYSFLENKPIHKFMLSRVDCIFVETENLFNDLKKYEFKNLAILNNFRNIKFDLICNNKTDILNLIFFARVHPMKGVNTIFNLDKKLKELKIKNVNIDIYGPVLDSYKHEFFYNINNTGVNYKGIISPEDIYSVLYKYDLMLFPTRFFTEGFPGSILDSYISGVPVIATNWLNATEFIDDGETGYIVDFDNDEIFIDKVIYLINNPYLIAEIKANVIKKRYIYSPDEAWNVLSLALKL